MTVLRNKSQLPITQPSCNTPGNMNDVIKTSEERRELSYKDQRISPEGFCVIFATDQQFNPPIWLLNVYFLESTMTNRIVKTYLKSLPLVQRHKTSG